MFDVLLLIGLVAIIGLAGRRLFERTRIPEILLLMGVGLLLGPLGLITSFGLQKIEPGYFESATPLVGAVVIIFLVFDAGFRLRAREIADHLSFSTPFAVANILACIAILVGLLHYALAWDWASSLFLAAILCGPSTYALYSILPFVRASRYARSVLYLEGTLSTIIVCLVATTLLRYSSGETLPSADALKLIAASFSVSFILGLAAGLLVLLSACAFRIKRFGYLLTFAALLVLYYADFVLLGGIGVISIAVIGFVLGNAPDILKFFRMDCQLEIDESFATLQSETGLFMSTFFFVYLGMTFRLSELSAYNLALALLLVAGMLASRLIVVWAARRLGHSQHREDILLTAMIPSDLLSATLATFTLLYPGAVQFSIELVLLVIAGTTIVTSLGVSYYERLLRGTYSFKREVRLKDGRTVVVRSFGKDDLRGLAKFLNDLVREGAMISMDHKVNLQEEKEMGMQSIARINRNEMIMLVGVCSGKIAARGSAEKMPGRERDNVSLSIYVAQEFRSAGLGTAMLRMLIEEAKSVLKPRNIYLTVYSDNTRAIKLYRKEGFAKIGALPGWMRHEDRYLDRIYMLYRGAPAAKSRKKRSR